MDQIQSNNSYWMAIEFVVDFLCRKCSYFFISSLSLCIGSYTIFFVCVVFWNGIVVIFCCCWLHLVVIKLAHNIALYVKNILKSHNQKMQQHNIMTTKTALPLFVHCCVFSLLYVVFVAIKVSQFERGQWIGWCWNFVHYSEL